MEVERLDWRTAVAARIISTMSSHLLSLTTAMREMWVVCRGRKRQAQ